MSTRRKSRLLVADADPAVTVTSIASGVSKNKPYVTPTDAERRIACTGLARLAICDLVGATQLLGSLGFTVTMAIDPATSRRYALAVSETQTPRAWGLYLVDLTRPLGLCVAVPHPKSDALCEQLALRLWRATPGAMLAMASIHRDAADGTADHAQNTESVFHHLWTDVIGPRGVPQVQIHGFADETASEQVVVSTGSGPVTPAAVRISDEIEATGLVTTRSWDGTADLDLRATGNEQGIAANAHGWVWVHVEHNRTVRDSPALWEPAIDGIAAANPALLAYDRPSPGGIGHAPKSVGAANVTGESRFFAREDHAHRGATATHDHAQPLMRFSPCTLTDAAAVTIDAARGDYFRVSVQGNRTLAVPTHGADGQRILVEALAAGGRRTLTLDASYARAAGIATTISIPSGKRWFGQLVNVQAVGWVLIASVVQA